MGNVVISSPTIGSDGRIYATSWDDRLYCLESSGSLAWYYPIPHISFTSPAIDSRGNVYACSAMYGERIYALDSGGAFLWSYRMLYGSDSSPSIGPEGDLYVGSWDNLLYAFDSDGALAWSYFTGPVFTSSPATDSDGTIFAGCADDRLYGLFPDGTLLWSYMAGGSSPAIDQAGYVYSGSTDNCLYGLTPGGSLAWSYRTGGSISHSAPALGTAGKLFVSSGDQRLYAFAWPPVPSPTATRTPTHPPTLTPTATATPTPTPPPTATPDSGVVLVPSGAKFDPGDPFTLGIRVSISIWARFDAYLFAVTPIGTYTILRNGHIRSGISPVVRGVRRVNAPFETTVLKGFSLPGVLAGQTTLYLVTVYAGHIPPVSDPSQLTMNTHYVITVDRRVIEVR